MLLNQHHITRLRFYSILFFLIFYSLIIQSQSNSLKIYIDEKLELIDENIVNKQYDLALNKIKELENYSSYVKIDENRLNLNLIKAKAYFGNNEQEKAINLLLNGLSEIELLPKLSNLKINYATFIGEIFLNARNFDKSLLYFKKSLNSSKTANDTINILNSYWSIGQVYYNKGDIIKADSVFNRIIDYEITKTTEEIIAKTYNSLGVLASDVEDLDLAEEYGEKALKIKQSLNDTLETAVSILNLSAIYYKKQDFEKAKRNYIKAYEDVKHMNSDRALNLKENILYNLAFVNEQLNDYKNAYKFLEEATSLSDSLSRANSTQQITEIEAKFNVAKKAQEVEEAESNAFRAQVFFYGLAMAFLAFIVFGYIFYRNYRLNQRSKLEQLENETQTKIINATIDAKEKERKSIAEILHDSVSALLSSANLHLQASKAQLKKDAPQEISKAQTIVNEASVKIRDLSHELISSVLLKFGLAFAVHDMCQKYSNSEITLHSDDNGIKRYDQDFEIKIHNIIEELINNILKHSKASNATIMMAHREKDMLSIRISDDGIGFDVKKAKYKDGLGLSHIGARVKVMKGVFNIISSSENGTSIFILVPIQHKKAA